MYSKIILNLVLIILLFAWQVSFISGLPLALNNLNLVLVILVFVLILGDFEIAAWWAVGLGLLLDIFYFSFFGSHLLSLFITLVITEFLLNNFFTNRSLYSFLALVFFASLVNGVMINIFSLSVKLLSKGELLIGVTFWQSQFYQLVLNLVVTALLFYLINFISKKFRPVFLLKKFK